MRLSYISLDDQGLYRLEEHSRPARAGIETQGVGQRPAWAWLTVVTLSAEEESHTAMTGTPVTLLTSSMIALPATAAV